MAPEGGSQSAHSPIQPDRPPLRLGITTPVLTLLPEGHASWEVDAGIEEVASVARTAEDLGYYHLTCSEHVVIPTDVAPVRGSRYWDPLATFGYLAAVTSRIRLATNVLVLGYHHPLEIAKRYGTLDQVCRGRLVLGLGVGSLEEEFDLLGAPFDDRGARADDSLGALRSSLSTNRPAYQGTYYRYGNVVMDPCALQPSVPIWIGGRTARSLRRAVELGDGWVPFAVRSAEVGVMLDRARQTPAWEGRTSPLEVVLQNGRPLDPIGDPNGSRAAVGKLVSVGATGLQLGFVHRSLDHYLEQLGALARMMESGLF